ncbi:MAG TPA: bifunctional alpha,alpha-trehalose-phosphate synthase (UDP-forming)/trehalose-phosphatase [Polyangiaceae bacterium]|nr:bifunctional alpha,alpha-trehalose-phosphate synthase (UDP-forming)/trehalose-phosphatase [Polyangiaceae bacterium]
MPRLVVVSNRLPFTLQLAGEQLEYAPSSGGLVSALSAYLESKHREDPTFEHLWVGWPGTAVPQELEVRVREESLATHAAYPVFLTAEDVQNFYDGFCNGTLWPLFHYFPSYVEYSPSYWDTYIRVNACFREALLEVLRPDDTIWVHDYQLLLLPGMIREKLPGASIGFFLHIPFPSHELFRLLPTPWKRQLLLGMLGADLIGFHTYEYTQYFLHCVFRILGHDHRLGQISVEDQVRRADTFPIGIDYDKFMTAATSEAVIHRRGELEASIHGKKAIFSVDRLDYTKGILNRLTGYEEFLVRYPQWLERVVFLLVIVPSREEVALYRRMKQEVDECVGRINGRFGTVEWAPVVYQYRSLDFETLVALYQLSPVALITPLRDGMNLVAKEYLASKPDGTGALVLSEMTGAARELGEAILINPNHWTEIAEALDQALTMGSEEQVQRNRPMQQRLKAYDAKWWAEQFLSSLSKVKSRQERLSTRSLAPPLQEEIKTAYHAARRALLLLDYDGTLVPFASQPSAAHPDPELEALLAALSREPQRHVFLVSGRDKHTLERWFAGLDIGLLAEHGAWVRRPGEEWKLLKPVTSGWKEGIAPMVRMYVGRVAGSLFEEKEFSVAWHYRQCDPDLGEQRAKELIDDITQLAANLDIQVLEGKKVVEIRNSAVNKGTAAAQLAQELDPDIILAIGDDQTDEDMFRALPDRAVTVRVGATFSRARYSLRDHRAVRRFLRLLT